MRNQNFKSLLLVAVLFFAAPLNGISQSSNAKAYAIFTYNFLKYAGYPASMKQQNQINVLFIGAAYTFDEFTKATKTRTIEGKKISVSKAGSLAELKPCHLIYLAESKSNLLPELVKKTAGSGTLIITEKEGLIKNGACISFIVVENKLKFQVNAQNLSDRNITLSRALTNLAHNG